MINEKNVYLRFQCLELVHKRNENLPTDELIKQADKLFKFCLGELDLDKQKIETQVVILKKELKDNFKN